MNRVLLSLLLLFSMYSLGNGQTLTKAFSLGDWLDQQAQVSMIASNGDVLIGGRSNGRPDFDPGPGVTKLDSALTGTGFLMRMDSVGNLLWVTQLDGPGMTSIEEISEDAAGNIYLAGTFGGTVDLNPGPGAYNVSAWGSSDVFLEKLDASGNFLWGGHIHAATSTQVNGLAWDGSGGVMIAGSSVGLLDLDPADATVDLHTAIGSRDGYLARITDAGVFDWGVSFGSSSGTDLLDMDVDEVNSEVVICGSFSGSVDLDPSSGSDLYSSSATDLFWSEFDLMTGGYLEGTAIGGLGSQRAWGIAVDDLGNRYMLGSYSGSTDVDPSLGVTTLSCLGIDDLFLAKYTSSGSFLWAVPIGSTGYDQGTSLALDAAGNPHILGHTTTAIDFDPTAATLLLPSAGPIGYYKHFAASYDVSGNLRWAGAASGPGGTTSSSIAVRPDGTALICGYFNGSVDLDPTDTKLPHTSEEDSATGISYDDLFVSWWKPDPCALLSVVTDAVTGFDCVSPDATIAVHGTLGLSPYTYAWSTGATSPSLSTTTGGIFTVTMTDATGCAKTASYLVDAPTAGPPDLQVDLFSSWLRAGFPAQIFVEGRNLSCSPVSGMMEVVLDPNLTYVSSDPTPVSVSGDTLRYSFTDLAFGGTGLVPAITVHIASGLSVGDLLCFDVFMSPTVGDAHPMDNIELHHCIPVVAPHDPNLIQVWPAGECDDNRVKMGEPLTYTVHFQNIGSIDAVNVVILDTLDSDLTALDVAVKTHSHDMYTEVLPGNVLKFIFPEIHLPDSATDEPGSHGFVTYEVTPSAALASGTEVHAKASIYFDFEEPIHTNEVWVTLVDSVLPCGVVGVADVGGDRPWELYPNPASQEVVIHSDSRLDEVQVMNVLGEILHRGHPAREECVLSVAELPAGIYLVSVRIGERQEVKRLLVQH